MTVVSSYGMVLCGNSSDSSNHRYRGKIEKVKFGVPISEAFSRDIPATLLVLLLKVNKEGPCKKDIWRAPGNQAQVRKLSQTMQHGRLLNIANVSVYTAASVIKKFLSKLPGGIFGIENETTLFSSVSDPDVEQQRQTFCSIFASLPQASQQILVILFGTFRMVADGAQEFGTKMTPEAIGISVAPSLFHSCIHEGQKAKVEDVQRFKLASQVVSNIIKSFGHTTLFPRACYEFYARITGRCLHYDPNSQWIFTFQYPSSKSNQPQVLVSTSEPVALSHIDAQHYDEDAENRMPSCSNFLDDQPCSSSDGMRVRAVTSGALNHSRLSQRLSSSVGEVLHASAEAQLDGAKSPSPLLTTHGDSTRSLSVLDSVHLMQARRMESRSQWFLSPTSARESSIERHKVELEGWRSARSPLAMSPELHLLQPRTDATDEGSSREPTPAKLLRHSSPMKALPMRHLLAQLSSMDIVVTPRLPRSPVDMRLKQSSVARCHNPALFASFVTYWKDMTPKPVLCRSQHPWSASQTTPPQERVPLAERKQPSVRRKNSTSSGHWSVHEPDAMPSTEDEADIARRRSWRKHYVRPSRQNEIALHGGGSLDVEDRPSPRGLSHAQSLRGEHFLVDSPPSASGSGGSATPSRKRSLKHKSSTKF